MEDRPGVLRVDDGGSARHRHRVVDHEGAEHLELAALLGDEDAAVGAADERIVVEAPAVGLESAAAHEDHLVESSLGVAHLDPVALGEGSASALLAEGRRRAR